MEEPIYVTRDFIEDVVRTKFRKKIIVLYDSGYGSGEINSSYADAHNLFLSIDSSEEIEELVERHYSTKRKRNENNFEV